MELSLVRFSDANGCTTGLMSVDGAFFCYALEDEHRAVKVRGETRIPAGRYPLAFRQVLSGMTAKYRQRFPGFFQWHLELQGVPGFTNVYIHAGNTDADTDGCILVGDTINNNRLAPAFLGNSGQAFERLYRRVAEELKAGKPVFIDVRDLQ